MSKIIRTPTRAEGGITAEEKILLDAHAQLWIKRAMRTDPIEADKIVPAIEGIYEAAGLKKPRVVIASSPLVMAFSYGAAAALLKKQTGAATASATYSVTRSATDSATRSATDSATYSATASATASATDSATDSATASATDSATYSATASATDSATDSATYSATRSATRSATDSATDSATRSATYSATRSATYFATASATKNPESEAAAACYDLAGNEGLECAKNWHNACQGGNMWASYESYLTAMRDIIGLKLPQHEAYHYWEQAAIHGGFRVLHPDFCIVSDFPEFIRVDENNEPHCENGPSHRWRDGWSLYHWHGQAVPAHWIEDRNNIDPTEVLNTENTEQRRAGCEIIGWDKIIDRLGGRIIDTDSDPEIGQLIECDLPDAPNTRFVKVRCATGRTFALCCDSNAKTALEAQAGLMGVDADIYRIIKPTITA
jgi:hypothetical protein